MEFMMKYLLQVDFPYDGPFADEMSKAFVELAQDIKKEEGLIWKIWMENETQKESGGIYLFDNEDDAKRYLDKHTKRLESCWYSKKKANIFYV